jgi:hypothetical protein
LNEADISWPVKRRKLPDRFVDSTRWNRFGFRDGDIVVASFGGAPNVSGAACG